MDLEDLLKFIVPYQRNVKYYPLQLQCFMQHLTPSCLQVR